MLVFFRFNVFDKLIKRTLTPRQSKTQLHFKPFPTAHIKDSILKIRFIITGNSLEDTTTPERSLAVKDSN